MLHSNTSKRLQAEWIMRKTRFHHLTSACLVPLFQTGNSYYHNLDKTLSIQICKYKNAHHVPQQLHANNARETNWKSPSYLNTWYWCGTWMILEKLFVVSKICKEISNYTVYFESHSRWSLWRWRKKPSPNFVPTRMIGTLAAKCLNSGIHCKKKWTRPWM